MDEARAQPDLEGVVLLHEDLVISEPELLNRIRWEFRDSGVGVVGAVGATGVRSLRWWEGEIHGRLAETRFVVEGVTTEREVEMVDGSFLCLSPWVVQNFRFDEERYEGFHGYDGEICATVRANGGSVIWARFDLFHATKGGYGDPSSFARNDQVFRQKWLTGDCVASQEWSASQ
jgi:hypothetical protein